MGFAPSGSSIRNHRRVEDGYEVANLWSGLSSTQPYRRYKPDRANCYFRKDEGRARAVRMGFTPSATIGGLRTVVRLQYYGSDCPQPHPQAPNCPLGKDEAPARAVRMSLYGWGMCPQGIAPSLSIHRTHIETRQDQILGQEADLTVKHKIFSPHL